MAAPDKEIAQGTVECVQETIDPPAGEPSAGPPGTLGALGPAAITLEEVPAAELSGVDDSIPPDIAVAKHEPALDGTWGDWAAGIAQLQALIEALTENVEWRIPNATRR